MLTQIEVRQAVTRAQQRFVDVCVAASDEQWRFHPTDGVGDKAWSMPQVVEHVTSANHGILSLLSKTATASPRGNQIPVFEDEDMPYIFYGGAGSPPPGLPEPTGTPADQAGSVRAFQESMEAILNWYDEIDIDLRECAVTHPAFGLFDGAQWLLFAAVHAQQHRGQLLDVTMASNQAALR